MLTIIAGSRGFSVKQALAEIDRAMGMKGWGEDTSMVVSGGARGVDQAGELWARRRGIEPWVVRAEWERYGKRAGMRRNEVMAEIGEMMGGRLLAIWDGRSSGTRDMVKRAKGKGLEVEVVVVREERDGHNT